MPMASKSYMKMWYECDSEAFFEGGSCLDKLLVYYLRFHCCDEMLVDVAMLFKISFVVLCIVYCMYYT